ncbi:hypothetical protein B0H14DRAFT_3509570 [Mycena olivaceomarginata]|nr:hypothetical protein B0H14DRAFT_3509570 [Mycena olivaceomarginata]
MLTSHPAEQQMTPPPAGIGIQVAHTDDEAIKLSDRVRRRCFNYRTTETRRGVIRLWAKSYVVSLFFPSLPFSFLAFLEFRAHALAIAPVPPTKIKVRRSTTPLLPVFSPALLRTARPPLGAAELEWNGGSRHNGSPASNPKLPGVDALRPTSRLASRMSARGGAAGGKDGGRRERSLDARKTQNVKRAAASAPGIPTLKATTTSLHFTFLFLPFLASYSSTVLSPSPSRSSSSPRTPLSSMYICVLFYSYHLASSSPSLLCLGSTPRCTLDTSLKTLVILPLPPAAVLSSLKYDTIRLRYGARVPIRTKTQKKVKFAMPQLRVWILETGVQ